MKFNIKYIYFVAIIFTALGSCTEKYNVKLDDTYTRLVIDGGITTDTMAHQIKLTTSSSYFFNETPPAISGAVVYLDNGSSKIRLTELAEQKGVYSTPADYYGTRGTTYALEIKLKDKIGESDQYEAAAVMPLTQFSIDSIALEHRMPMDFYLMKLYFKDPPTNDFYKFDALINDRMITDTASRSLVRDDRFFNGNATNGMVVMFIRGDEVRSGDTVTLLMSAISKDYYQFFLELRTEAGGSNPLFSGPPANVRSNLKVGGLGYFSARKTVKATVTVPSK